MAAYQIQRMLEAARVKDQEARVLDTILATAVAYLDLLRAEALLEVDRKNLTVTESNLQRATSRLELGVGTRSEIYRWETARANAQASVVTSEATAKQARITLNRTMNEPLGSQYATETPSLDAAYFMVSSPEIRAELRTPRLARAVAQDTSSTKRCTAHPKSKRCNNGSTRRTGNSPPGNARSTCRNCPRKPASIRNSAAAATAPSKSISRNCFRVHRAASPTKPTGSSVSRPACRFIKAAHARPSEIARKRNSIRSSCVTTSSWSICKPACCSRCLSTEARFDRIGYSNTAATAGHNNLELVTEAYGRGVMTVTDLVDAQFSAFNADQNAANAVYDFLIDYLRLQRFTGSSTSLQPNRTAPQ